ncbi:VOC family protein [Gryllotalpicola protaetiae]|uniref:VOC family protein n=1 Tax=Gryllotalpicola protaetiae TaxID=2419771 RepID=UPI0013C45CBA|nr:VOC family protein [Gryllotalpicola protaetiae]
MSIYVSVPVADVERSTRFFTAIGWSVDERFSSEHGTGFVIADGQYLMVVEREFFAGMVKSGKTLGDPAKVALAAIAFDLPSREAVEELVARAAAAGATLDEPDDYGFMYQHGFDDPDGNHFEPMWADPSA